MFKIINNWNSNEFIYFTFKLKHKKLLPCFSVDSFVLIQLKRFYDQLNFYLNVVKL